MWSRILTRIKLRPRLMRYFRDRKRQQAHREECHNRGYFGCDATPESRLTAANHVRQLRRDYPHLVGLRWKYA